MKRRILMILIAVLSAVLLLIIGAVIGMNLQTNTIQTSITPNNENQDEALVDPIDNDTDSEDTDESEVADVMLDFASDRYDIQFSYPEEYGDYELTVDELYFYGERVSFTNSNISVGYTRYEGSAGYTTDNVAEGSVTTKQGYEGSYFIYQEGTSFMLFVRIASPGTNGALTTVTSSATTQAGAEAELIKVQEILDTLEFDFSDVPLSGCEVSCR